MRQEVKRASEAYHLSKFEREASQRSRGQMGDSTDLDIRRARAARNQSLFREVNERIQAMSASASFKSFVYECADVACHEQVPLTLEEYERVRSQAD